MLFWKQKHRVSIFLGGGRLSKKTFELLTETMFYVLMAFRSGEWCGAEAVDWVARRTNGRVRMGPGTLYTILAKFEDEDVLRPTEVSGRRKHYAITEKGNRLYEEELARLRQCVADAEQEER